MERRTPRARRRESETGRSRADRPGAMRDTTEHHRPGGGSRNTETRVDRAEKHAARHRQDHIAVRALRQLSSARSPSRCRAARAGGDEPRTPARPASRGEVGAALPRTRSARTSTRRAASAPGPRGSRPARRRTAEAPNRPLQRQGSREPTTPRRYALKSSWSASFLGVYAPHCGRHVAAAFSASLVMDQWLACQAALPLRTRMA